MDKVHQIQLTERNMLTVTCLNEVVSFDDTVVNLDVGGAFLTVSGSGLSVLKLSLDESEGTEIVIGGKVDAIVYTDGQKKRKRLFG